MQDPFFCLYCDEYHFLSEKCTKLEADIKKEEAEKVERTITFPWLNTMLVSIADQTRRMGCDLNDVDSIDIGSSVDTFKTVIVYIRWKK